MHRRFPPVRFRYILVIILVSLAFSALAGWIHVSPEEFAVRRGPIGSRILDPGFHLRIPFLQSVVRYPTSAIFLRDEAVFVSPEGARRNLPYEAVVRIDRDGLLRLDRARGKTPLEEFLRGEIGSGLPESIPEISAHLAGRGVILDEIRLGEMAGSLFRAAVGRRPAWARTLREGGGKILVVGIDGADWQILRPLLDRGDLPVLGRLVREGATAALKSSPPILSPLLWTTVATGRSPEEHGIVDFLVRDPVRQTKLPISSHYRKVKALWNLFSEADRSVDVVAWWATWPAETIRGRMVTDRVAYSLFGYQGTDSDRQGATYPSELLEAIDPLVVDPEAISYRDINRFIAISPEEYDAARAEVEGDRRKAYRNPINHLARIIASTRTYAAAAGELLRRGQPDLFMLYFQGIDEVCHRFAQYMPPKMDRVSEADYRKFSSAVEEFYRFQDELLGEIIAAVETGTTILILSDHGFLNGPDRPIDASPGIEGKPAKWHRLYGVWILHGPEVRPGPIDWVSLYDTAPTILHMAGLPVSGEMSGRPVLEALQGELADERRVVRVPTFESEGGSRMEARIAQPAIEAEMLEKLRSLGYIGSGEEEEGGVEDPDTATQETVTFHSNLGSVYLQKGAFGQAEEELRKAVALFPGYIPARQMLIQIQVHQKRWDEALDGSRRIIDSGREFELNLFHQLAKIYRGRGDLEAGLEFLESLLPRFPGSSEIQSAIGTLEMERQEIARAETRFRAALEIDPADLEAMTRLFQLYKERGEMARVRQLLERALEKSPRSVMHRNWMGLVLQAAGDLAGAEREFLRARQTDPDFPGTLANLGALYGRTGRLAEAEPILQKAVEGHPQNIEARVNLGAVLGKLGRSNEAAECLEGAIALGYRTPDLYNAIGRAHFEAGNLPGAIEALKESLGMDPNQPEIRDILMELEETG
ncbi:MAG: tetratricopeptide repeat protein [Acidobacteriota bacterium]